MSDTEKNIFETVFGYLQGFIAETAFMLFLFGLSLFLVGLFLILLRFYIRFKGYTTQGKVLGAVKKCRVKHKPTGKSGETVNCSYTAVFEYSRPDGMMHIEKASEGGSHVLKYKTGQSVSILVVPQTNYDDVYDAKRNTATYITLVLVILGGVIMERAADIIASLSIGLTAGLILIVSTIMKVKSRSKKQKASGTGSRRHSREFNPADIIPIEQIKTEKA